VVVVAREAARSWIAYILLGAVILMIISCFVAFLWFGRTADEIKNLGEFLFTPIIGLVGAVIGFYFGVERQQPSS
jgi:hypothetical protein